MEQISRIAVELGRTATIAIRVNPDVNAITHPYISTGLREHKFGIDMREAERVYAHAMKLDGIRPEGVSCHIGSQLLDMGPLLEAADKVVALVKRLRALGVNIRFLDLGGGIGVRYRPTDGIISIGEFISHLRLKIESLEVTLMLEPGRSIIADAGVLLCRVILTKQNGQKHFVIVDAGMNDLIRPSLYGAHHEIIPVRQVPGKREIEADIVGPVCETGDFFARHRSIAEVQPGDLLAIQTAGAYGFVLSSNYNSRPRACELLVVGDKVQVVRQRETYKNLIRGEQSLA
jgi:diaminopimelate decarboxylase